MKRKPYQEILRNESGQALVLVIILLVVGVLFIIPVLYYLMTGLKVGEVYETEMAELYAADAGVNQVIPYLKHGMYIPDAGEDDVTFTSPSAPNNPSDNLTDVNNKGLEVTIHTQYRSDAYGMYKITSVANNPVDSTNTTIETWLKVIPYFWTNAATSINEVTWPGEGGGGPGGDPEITGPDEYYPWVEEYYDPDEWPFSLDLANYYRTIGFRDVNGDQQNTDNCSWPTEVISGSQGVAGYDLNTTDNLGPFYFESYTVPVPPPPPDKVYDMNILEIYCSDNIPVQLMGTLYINNTVNDPSPGKYEAIFGPAYSSQFTLDLNYQTIYCTADMKFPQSITLTGSGCIIADGDIDFKPNIESEEGDFIFVMSENGQVLFQPGGDFYGALAGNDLVYLNTPCYLELTEAPAELLNFPLEGIKGAVKILSWKIR